MNECRLAQIMVNPITFPSYLADAVERYKKTDDQAELVRVQQRLERYLLSISICRGRPGNVEITKYHQVNFHRLDDVALGKILNTPESLNCFLHEQLECLINGVLLSEESEFTERERVTQWFTNLRRIGESSVRSYALSADISPRPQGTFVIKTTRELGNETLLHEAVIGMIALNGLRRLIPNFMYTYGYFRCSPTYLIDNEPSTWCNLPRGREGPYTIVENIRNASVLGDLVLSGTLSPEDLLVIMYQIFNALNVASKIWNFTHFDLHSNNVLVRVFDKEVAIPYYGVEDKARRWFITKYVPYIIDYDASSIRVGGVDLDDPNRLHGRVGSFPMFDVYRIVTGVGQESIRDPNLFPLMKTMFGFFSEGSLRKRILRTLNDPDDFYQADPKYRGITHDKFLIYLEQKLPPPVVVRTFNVWTFTQLQRPFTDCQLYDAIGKTPKITAVSYCELVQDVRGADMQTQTWVQEATKKFDARQFFSINFLPRVQAQVLLEWRKQERLPIPRLAKTVSPGELTLINKEYYARVITFMNMRRDVEYIRTELKANLCALTHQQVPTSQYTEGVQEIEKVIDYYDKFLRTQRKIMESNDKIIRRVFPRQKINQTGWKDHSRWLLLI